MPRNTSGIFTILPGTEGIPDTTIESAKYNAYIHDVETDLNTPRPIVAGGTGANDADEALSNLGAEKSSQKVLNYDTHVFRPGSFYSDTAATASPVAGHAFVGWAVSSDPPADPPANQNVVVHARDETTTVPAPGRLYVREKKAGVWGPWGIDGSGIAGDTPPLSPPDGALWWDNVTGQLYIYYNDGNSKQWVIASPVPDPAQYLLKAGDTMQGTLGLQAPPVSALQAANKKYVDDAIATAAAAIPPQQPPFPSGTIMLFVQNAAPTGWTKRTDYNDYALRLTGGNITAGGAVGFSGIFGSNTVGAHTLTANEQASMTVSGSFSGSGTGATATGGRVGIYDDSNPTLGHTVGLAGPGWYATDPGVNVTVSGSISGTAGGGGAAHSHPLNLNLAYLDVIMATKN